MKEELVTASMSSYPDPTRKYILDTDASDVGVEAVLSQVQEGKELVIAYYSKTPAPPEKNYCVARKELLAVVKAVKHFQPYLYGGQFKLKTDHTSFRWQVARWLEILAEFQDTLENEAGFQHRNVGHLIRRRNCKRCRQCDNIDKRDGALADLKYIRAG